jgi:hypothetical protein
MGTADVGWPVAEEDDPRMTQMDADEEENRQDQQDGQDKDRDT